MIAVLDAKRAGLLRREHWVSNLIAGTIVGVVALPMAFAIASGVRPEQGIYTAIIAGLVVSLAGGSRVQIAGPTGAFIVVLAGIVSTHGLAGLQLATLMAGLILVVMGVLRLGAIVRFIPAPVIAGFTAGIGVIIWVGQWDAFFGLPKPEGERFHEKLLHLIRSLPDLDPATTGLAALGLTILLVNPRIPRLRRIPGPLIAMVVVTLLQNAIGFSGVATVGTAFGGIPTGLPSFTPPNVSFGMIVDLLGPAFTIAMLGAIESLLSAVVADGMSGARHDSNQELKGQGIANVACALFGGIAATGAIARTATNIRNGGTSPIAGVTHSLVLVAIVLVLAPLASDVPLAVLAAILFIVAYNMSDVRHFVRMARGAPAADVGILLVTFVLTMFADLVIAVNVGVLLATLQFLRRMSTSREV
ncbi:MAG: SulP family inorganic anion transporter, partial [Thermomicrobiales bacterium]